jgi:hypothetical protein
MIPSASRFPLVTITSRPLLLSMKTNRELYQLLYSNMETREGAVDLWEAALQARLMGSSFYCSYTPINPNSSNLQSLNYSQTRRQLLSSLPSGTQPGVEGIYSCEGLGIQTCQAVGYTPYGYGGREWFLFRICRDGKALIHTEDLDLLAQRLPSPSYGTPWHLIFIVPPEMKDKISLQPFIGDGDWESGRKIVQCVTVMDL